MAIATQTTNIALNIELPAVNAISVLNAKVKQPLQALENVWVIEIQGENKRLGIKPNVSIMYGLPWTYETITEFVKGL